MHFSKTTAFAALAATPLAFAQTSTDCNPTEKTCPNDTGIESSSFSSDFTKGSSAFSSWSAATGTTLSYGSSGAEFIIKTEGQAPTVQTDFYIFFGRVDVKMQAATGTGIVSSIVLESDDLDEIDWEFLGGDTTQVETNYFGKGNTSTYDRAIYYPVSSPQTTMHTYSIDWTSSKIDFIIDGATVRTLNYADANGGSNFPQTPMRLKLGSWAAGASGEPAGTVEWAGGSTDFSQSPFTMYVAEVSVTNYNPASEYEWTDKTGSYESIKLIKSDGSSSSASSSSSSSSGSSSSGSSSSSTTSKAASASTSSVKAPTSKHSVKEVAQTDAVVSSTSLGASASTTVSSLMSSGATAATAGKAGHGNSTASTTMSSSVRATSTSTSTSTSSSNRTASASVAQQTTNSGAANGVAATLVSLAALAAAFMML